jgi:hypothetical protein
MLAKNWVSTIRQASKIQNKPGGLYRRRFQAVSLIEFPKIEGIGKKEMSDRLRNVYE